MTDATTPERDDEDLILAGEHVLGLLGAAAEWAEGFTQLADDIPEVAPPAHVKAAITRRLFARQQESRLSRMLASFLGLGAVLAAAALAVVLFLDPFSPALSPATLIARIDGETSGVQMIAGWHPDENVMVVRRTAGEARPGRVIELWLIEGENAPVSLGVLPADDEVNLVFSDEIEARLPGAILAISDEPPGGSPTGAPTGEVLGLAPLDAV